MQRCCPVDAPGLCVDQAHWLVSQGATMLKDPPWGLTNNPQQSVATPAVWCCCYHNSQGTAALLQQNN